MVRKTKKAVKSKSQKEVKPMTVPKLRQAFEHIQSFLHKGTSISAFRKEWKKVFGTELSEKVAADYLAFVQAEGKGKSGNPQKGGSMSPAPLGYSMSMPSQAGTPSVPAYIAGGMALPSDSVAETCGQAKNPFLPPAPSMGSNLVGGKRTRKRRQNGGAYASLSTAFSEFLQRPIQMASPPGAANDLMMLSKGYNQFSSPRPEINPVGGHPPPSIYTAGILPVSKTF